MAQELRLYKLHYSTPLHVGNERADYDAGSAFLHSDTLYAAIWSMYARLGWEAHIPAPGGKPAFCLSSLFPFQQVGDRAIRYFPRPLYSPPAIEQESQTQVRKKIKKAVWVSQQILERILGGQSLSAYQQAEYFCGSFWADVPINRPPVSASRSGDPKTQTAIPQAGYRPTESVVVPRIRVSRTGAEDTQIFYIERFFFQQGAGLFCLATFDDKAERERFEAALRLLGDEGLGTDRNIGHGKFTVADEPWSGFKTKSRLGLSINLGLYCPEDRGQLAEALQPAEAGYSLLRRGGWMSEPYNSWRKRTVHMFREGSCFRAGQARQVYADGALVDLRPTDVAVPHPVWRCGRCLFYSF